MRRIALLAVFAPLLAEPAGAWQRCQYFTMAASLAASCKATAGASPILMAADILKPLVCSCTGLRGTGTSAHDDAGARGASQPHAGRCPTHTRHAYRRHAIIRRRDFAVCAG